MSAAQAGPPPVIDPGTCRCCGAMKRCRLLTIEYHHLGSKEIYSDMIMDCFGLLISYIDSKPTERLICATCVVRLRDAMAFKKQVLMCEEAFLQMKMIDGGEASSSHTSAYPETPKVKVKVETDDLETPGLDNDTLGDNYHDSTPLYVFMEVDSNSNDDTPLCTLAAKKKSLNLNTPSNPSPVSKKSNLNLNNYDLKLKSKLTKVKSKEEIIKIRNKDIKSKNEFLKEITQQSEDSKKKELSAMQRMHEIVRESDTAYMVEHNILTIIEYSFACPFKCRHNVLLCYYCGEYFSDPELLRNHTETKHNPNKFKINEKAMIKVDLSRIDCRLCRKNIETLEDFKKHLNLEHNKKYYHQQKDSILPFKLSKEMKCALCEKKFEYFHALNKHMNDHFRNFVCDQCGLGFVDRGRFLMHQQRHETGDYPCGECGKVFKAQYNRELHIDRVHKKIPHVYCPKCNVKLMTYHSKLKHLVEVHGEEPLRFPCDMCERVFNNRRMLTVHRRKEHLKDFRYECQYCSQKYFTRFALNNHLPTHTGERNFKCKVCEKSYPRLKTLKDHMRIHTNDRRYRCQICGQGFIQNCSLKGHMKSQHPEYG